MRSILLIVLLFQVVTIPQIAHAAERKKGTAEDVMMQCQKEAADKQIIMDKLQQYLKQCIARKSIDAGIVEKQ